MDSVGLRRAQERMLFRRPVFNIQEIVDPQRVLVGVRFQLQSTLFGVYREAQLESKRKRYTFAANHGEVWVQQTLGCTDWSLPYWGGTELKNAFEHIFVVRMTSILVQLKLKNV